MPAALRRPRFFMISPYPSLSNGGQPVGNCPSGWFFCRIKYVRNVSVLHTRRASRSPRRMRPDLQVESVRGNVDTRLQARRGAVCRHRIGRRWTEPLGIVEPDRRGARARGDVPGGGAGRTGHRDAAWRERVPGFGPRSNTSGGDCGARRAVGAGRRLSDPDRRPCARGWGQTSGNGDCAVDRWRGVGSRWRGRLGK